MAASVLSCRCQCILNCFCKSYPVSLFLWLSLILAASVFSFAVIRLFLFHKPLLGGQSGSNSTSKDYHELLPTPLALEDGRDKLTDVRLPTDIRPLYYKVYLVPHLEGSFTIDGKVVIDVTVLEATDRITLHIKNITIHESSVSVEEISSEGSDDGQGNRLWVVMHDYDIPREFYSIALNEKLKNGKIYRIFIKFTAQLSDNLAGFHRIPYKDLATNETRWMAATQFESTDARSAFPCFDEPALKAIFEISLGRKAGMSSISNMNLRQTEPIQGMEGWMWDHYHKSVPMSTYLVAFVISDFEKRVSDPKLSKPAFAVWARKDAIEQAEYASDIGPRILTFLENYFSIPFPLPKQDMVALPDMNVDAMENWGLVTFRENTLLCDNKKGTEHLREHIASIVAHELSHQWFGNLVTPSWWSDLWLNEGFATYIEYLGVDYIDPEGKKLERFVLEELQSSFQLDALSSSHPVSAAVHHPDEIAQLFDDISYAKGASIIRMMNHFLTEETFRLGLKNYLQKWQYKSTTQADLWDALTKQAWLDKTLDLEVDVGAIMDTWTLQKGYPVVTVQRDYGENGAKFTQSKFRISTRGNEDEEQLEENYRWWVPISYASSSFNHEFLRTRPEFWIEKSEHSKYVPLRADANDWIIVNVQETGFYRVNYDRQNWNLIIHQLKRNLTGIHVVNRAQILDDSFNLAKASLLTYDTVFNLINYIQNESEYIPWDTFLSGISYILVMLRKTPAYEVFKKFMRNLLEGQYSELGLFPSENEHRLRTFHRTSIVHWACAMEIQDCVTNVKNLFGSWIKEVDPEKFSSIPASMKRVIYCHAIKYGGVEEWNFLWERYKRSNVASEKTSILKALACSRDAKILNRFIEKTISPDSGIKKHDTISLLATIGGNEVGYRLVFDFALQKWATVTKIFPSSMSSLDSIFITFSHRLTTHSELQQLLDFQAKYASDLESYSAAVEQSIERVKANIHWMETNYKTIEEWLLKATADHGNAIGKMIPK